MRTGRVIKGERIGLGVQLSDEFLPNMQELVNLNPKTTKQEQKSKIKQYRQSGWCTLTIPAPGRWRQEMLNSRPAWAAH